MLNEFKDYLQVRGYGKTYLDNIKPFLSYCEDNKIDFIKLTYDNFNSYILYLQSKDFGAGYINNLLKAVRCFYRCLVDTQKVDESFLTTILKFKLLATERKIKDCLTKKELDELISQGMTFINLIKPDKLKTLLYFLYYTGLRKGEILNLKRGDIDIEKLKAIVRVPTKNKQERIIFFPQKVGKLLRKYFEVEPQANCNAFNLSSSKLNYLISQLKPYAPEGKNLTIHTFRHSFANMLASNEINVRVAQKLLGHKSMASTLIYYDPDINIIEKIYKDKVK